MKHAHTNKQKRKERSPLTESKPGKNNQQIIKHNNTMTKISESIKEGGKKKKIALLLSFHERKSSMSVKI